MISHVKSLILPIALLAILNQPCEADLPVFWEKAVVMLEKISLDNNGQTRIEPHGTGFLYFDSALGNCLITNRHILAGRDSIYIRYNLSERQRTDSSSEFHREICYLKDTAGNYLWAGHKNPRIDVGAVKLRVPSTVDARRFDSERLKSFRDIRVGERVYFYGFPLLLYGLEGQGDYPILRTGIISFRSEHLTYLSRQIIDSGVFLIDGFSFQGNSGSPVIIPSKLKQKGALIGIVFGHIANTYNRQIQIPPLKVSLPTGDTIEISIPPYDISYEENAGLAKAVCSDMIKETLDELRKKY